MPVLARCLHVLRTRKRLLNVGHEVVGTLDAAAHADHRGRDASSRQLVVGSAVQPNLPESTTVERGGGRYHPPPQWCVTSAVQTVVVPYEEKGGMFTAMSVSLPPDSSSTLS